MRSLWEVFILKQSFFTSNLDNKIPENEESLILTYIFSLYFFFFLFQRKSFGKRKISALELSSYIGCSV
ncbi:MAG: hypothetical protein D6785_02250, partial [Planctomycetota bacterium]